MELENISVLIIFIKIFMIKINYIDFFSHCYSLLLFLLLLLILFPY